jgi:hypothetical protein
VDGWYLGCSITFPAPDDEGHAQYGTIFERFHAYWSPEPHTLSSHLAVSHFTLKMISPLELACWNSLEPKHVFVN